LFLFGIRHIHIYTERATLIEIATLFLVLGVKRKRKKTEQLRTKKQQHGTNKNSFNRRIELT